MRWLIIPLLALAGCGRTNGPDEAAVQARLEQVANGSSGWDHHPAVRGAAHDATAAEAAAGDIPRGTTVWPVRASATTRLNGRATEVQRDFLFYEAGEDRHWVGVNAPNGTTDRYR